MAGFERQLSRQGQAEEAIRHRFWFKPEGQDLKLMDIRVRAGREQRGQSWVMIHSLAAGLVVVIGRRALCDMEVTGPVR